jgi:thiamine pyrophosphate-dependent acetolactate synthase large subunit-like protein
MIERRSAVATLLSERGDLLVVAGLGSPTYDAFAAGDDDLNFYLWGAMGSAALVGLGLAMSQPDRPVAVLTGDGEMLMGVGAFATIAQHRPPNLSVIILDNEQYAETGMQPTATGFGADLTGMALAAGVPNALTLREQRELEPLRTRIHHRAGPLVAVLKIAPGDQPRTLPLRDGATITQRFRTALLGHALADG